MLCVWLFTLFVGAAHACGWIEPSAASSLAVAGKLNERDRSSGVNGLSGCAQLRKTGVPIVTKLPVVGDPSDAQPLIVAARDVSVTLDLPPARRLAQAGHPRSGVAPFLRFSQLRL